MNKKELKAIFKANINDPRLEGFIMVYLSDKPSEMRIAMRLPNPSQNKLWAAWDDRANLIAQALRFRWQVIHKGDKRRPIIKMRPSPWKALEIYHEGWDDWEW